MLQVALCPAAIPHDEVAERRRASLIGAFQRWYHVHLPSGAAEERSLNKIMAEDQSTERGCAGQDGQARRGREGLAPYDGVVTPIVTPGTVPSGKSRRDDRTVVAGGKLLQASKQRSAAHEAWNRLNQPGAWVSIHCRGQSQERLGRHDAV